MLTFVSITFLSILIYSKQVYLVIINNNRCVGSLLVVWLGLDISIMTLQKEEEFFIGRGFFRGTIRSGGESLVNTPNIRESVVYL